MQGWTNTTALMLLLAAWGLEDHRIVAKYSQTKILLDLAKRLNKPINRATVINFYQAETPAF